MTMTEMQAEALSNARNGSSVANYSAIYAGFEAMGIEPGHIQPRLNVLTFHAWKALGRSVKKGEHGVRVVTWVPMTKKNARTGESETIGKRPKTTVVFHISQTETR